jgi:hypothetical protein
MTGFKLRMIQSLLKLRNQKVMILIKTNLYVTFSLTRTPDRTISKNLEIKFYHQNNSLIFYFNFLSFKSDLNKNQVGQEILNYLETFHIPEFDDAHASKNLMLNIMKLSHLI